MPDDEPTSNGPESFLFTLADVQAEWPVADLRPEVDLSVWHQGRMAFEAADADDPIALREAVRMVCIGLRHHLYRNDFLPANEHGRADLHLVGSVHEACVGSVIGREEHEFTTDDERHFRLGLTVARRYGLQPAEMGGDDTFSALFDDQQMNMAMYLVLGHGRLGAPEDFFGQGDPPQHFQGSSGEPLVDGFEDPFWSQTTFEGSAPGVAVLMSSGDTNYGVRKSGDEYATDSIMGTHLDDPKWCGRVFKEIVNIIVFGIATKKVSMEDVTAAMGVPADLELMFGPEREAFLLLVNHPATGSSPEPYDRKIFELSHQPEVASETISYLSSIVSRLDLLPHFMLNAAGGSDDS